MNTSTNEDVIFEKMDANTDSTVWDDEALIRVYDKATANTYEKVQKRDKSSKASTRTGKSTSHDVPTSKDSGGKVWKVGDTCMAMYEEDGKCYPAKILSVDLSKDKYEVVYTEYNENAVLSHDKLFRRAPTSTFSAYDDEVASKRRRLNNINSDGVVTSSNSTAILSSGCAPVGESWRKTSSVSTMNSSWKVLSSSEILRHPSSRQPILSSSPGSSPPPIGISAEYLSPTTIEYQHTWKKYHVTTEDYTVTGTIQRLQHDAARDDAQIDSADLYALLNAGYPPEVLNEIVESRLLKAGYIVNDVNSPTSGLSRSNTPGRKLTDRESSSEPQHKRTKTYPPPLIGAPPPPSAILIPSTPDALSVCDSAKMSRGSGENFKENPNLVANPFKVMSYSGYDDYTLFDPVVMSDTGRLRSKTFKQTLEEMELQPISRIKTFFHDVPTFKHRSKIRHEHYYNREKGSKNVQENKKSMQDAPEEGLQRVTTSPDPPEYSKEQLTKVRRLSIIAARKYALENQPKFANMKHVFDCRITKVVQQIADSCVGSLNRALFINGVDVADKHDDIVFTEVTKTVKRLVTLSTKRKENCPPPVGLKALEHGASAFKIYCEEIHERLRQLPNGKMENNDRFDLSDDEVEWTDEDQGLDDEEKASVSVINNGKQETFPIPDLCPPPPPALFGKVAQAGNNKEALTNMLMSWYMSGYHTGYYQGMQQAKAGNSSTAVKRTNR